MLRKDQKLNRGFTIIEVLIVLAIAGLIMLVVFMAVPTLQRSSRNTTLKNDVSIVLATISEFQNNNSGKMPTDVRSDNGTITVSGSTGTTAATGTIQGSTEVGMGTTMPTSDQTGKVNIALNYKCNGNALGSRTTRSVAALYLVETAGDPSAQCQAS